MKAIERPDIRDHYLAMGRAKVLNDRGQDIHASDLDLCPLKVFYRRTLADAPPLPEKSILFFMSGLAIEQWLISGKQEPVSKDGIICSIDDITKYGVSEIKTTRSGLNKFDPLKSYPWWIFRMKTYCHTLEIDAINLVVIFLVGDRGATQIEMKAWEIQFTNQELIEHWFEVQRRARILRTAMTTGEPIPEDQVWLQTWECKNCEMTPICYYYNQKVIWA